jgi:hypothetical protein
MYIPLLVITYDFEGYQLLVVDLPGRMQRRRVGEMVSPRRVSRP